MKTTENHRKISVLSRKRDNRFWRPSASDHALRFLSMLRATCASVRTSLPPGLNKDGGIGDPGYRQSNRREDMKPSSMKGGVKMCEQVSTPPLLLPVFLKTHTANVTDDEVSK